MGGPRAEEGDFELSVFSQSTNLVGQYDEILFDCRSTDGDSEFFGKRARGGTPTHSTDRTD